MMSGRVAIALSSAALAVAVLGVTPLGSAAGSALNFYPLSGLMAPDSDLTRVVVARVSDSCTGAEQNFTFKSLKLDVIGAS